MKFRKRPVVIDAFQWTQAMHEGPTRDWIILGVKNIGGDMFPAPAIQTLEGEMEVSIGDWIIRGIQGELYPCKPDIFEATYQAADQKPEELAKADLWIERGDISPHIHPAMAGLLDKYLKATVEECRGWTAAVNATMRGSGVEPADRR